MYHSKVNSLLCNNNLGDFLLLHHGRHFSSHRIYIRGNGIFPHDLLCCEMVIGAVILEHPSNVAIGYNPNNFVMSVYNGCGSEPIFCDG